MPKLSLSSSQITRGRIIAATLCLVAIGYILVQQFLLRTAACANQMCPVNDYTYLYRIVAVIAITSVAIWLLKPNPPQS